MSQKIFYPSLDAMNMETTRTTESVQIIQPPIKGVQDKIELPRDA
jgi:hypothetical protein